MKILIAGTNYISSEIKRYLAVDGFDCELVSDDWEALSKFWKALRSGSRYDLILLFDLLCGSNSLDLLPEIRGLEREHNRLSDFSSRIIIVTDQYNHPRYFSAVKDDRVFCISLPSDVLKLSMLLESDHTNFESRFQPYP